MKEYDATEVAFKNGHEQGEVKGYERGFADGLAAAGIAPVQWRDVCDVPFDPEGDADYLLICDGFSDQAFRWKELILHDRLLHLVGRERFRVLFWCPIQFPEMKEKETDYV